MHPAKMTPTEKRATLSLSIIMGLRMLGLFMVLPVFSLYAANLHGSTPLLIGVAMGIYGLFQAIFQITFGSLSDRLGRKPAILTALIIFAAGSIIAGMAGSIGMMIVGRTLQGIGAIGSTTMAFLADLTREEQRTKAMMIAGITIGFSFSAAMLLGPLLTPWTSVSGLFYLAAVLAALAAAILFIYVPTPINLRWHHDTEPELKSFIRLLTVPDLARLNIGIFILHAIFTASFVVIPIAMHQYSGLAANQQWEIYLPALLTALVACTICIGLAERKHQIKRYFIGGILAIAFAEIILWTNATHLSSMTIGIAVFFAGFTLLEAFLPSLVSRTAPASCKGSAMGIYSCAQYSGIFAGGVLGGFIYSHYHFSGVYLFCVALALFWFILACFMRQPRYLVIEVIRLTPAHLPQWNSIAEKLQRITGMAEVTLVAEDHLAYVKMERKTIQDPDFIRIKEQLQSSNS
jgi:MFS family permease